MWQKNIVVFGLSFKSDINDMRAEANRGLVQVGAKINILLLKKAIEEKRIGKIFNGMTRVF